jgi:N-methylhydantoinase B
MGLRRVYRAEADCRVRVDIARRLSAPWGLFGGLPGGNAAVVLGGGALPFDHGSGALRKGEIVEVVTAGSGGYGSPGKRDKDAVRSDVAEGRLDVTTASKVYGVSASAG